MDVEPNAELRAQRATKDVALPTGPRLSFQDLADHYHIGLEQLESMVKRERQRTCLTTREREVLIWYAKGEQVKNSASTLGISSRTAETHLYNCLRKLQLTSTRMAVNYCILAGWMEPGDGLPPTARASAERQRRVDAGEEIGAV